MPKRTYGHRVDSNGRAHVVDETLPKHLQGCSEWSEGTLVDGPLKRLFSKKGTR